MDNVLKQRLVGAAVMVAVAVIVIPLLLDGSGEQVISEIPPPPAPIATDPARLSQGLPPLPATTGARSAEEVTAPEPDSDTAAAVREADEAPTQAAPPVATAPAVQPRASGSPAESGPGRTGATEGTEPGAGELHSWVVQVGSFAEQEKARSLRDELRAAGFTSTYVEQHRIRERTMYRVRIGPHMERGHAEQTLARLRDQTAHQGYVARHP